jgi:hypothetical protein
MEPGVLEKLIESYIKLRDKKLEVGKQQAAVLKEYSDAMAGIESIFMAHLQEQNINSVSCDAGTAFIKRSRKATVPDKAAFTEYVIRTGEFYLCDMSAKVEAVEDWSNANSGMLPPGVNFRTYEVVQIQRK